MLSVTCIMLRLFVVKGKKGGCTLYMQGGKTTGVIGSHFLLLTIQLHGEG